MWEVFVLWLLFTVMPNISILFGLPFTILVCGWVIVGTISIFGGYDDMQPIINKAKKLKTYIHMIVIGFILTIFIPSSDQMKILIGGYFAVNTVEAVGNVEGIERLPENVVKAMNKFLEEEVDE